MSSEPDAPTESAVPAITLPKGGGAIRGVGEKFAANPVNGSGTTSVPLGLSPGRSGFGPQLELTYDSGAGNGPFGFGWSMFLPAITRKTDKGLPRYDDAAESDVFVLSGAEDLVPVLDQHGDPLEDTTTMPGWRIKRYRPRIEGLFARIERWTRVDEPTDVHWRSLSRDNILTLYGRDGGSRIVDPDDARRIFSWRICESRDPKGNAILYTYKEDGASGVDLRAAHERNRSSRSSNRYLDRIRYGNRTSLLTSTGERPRFLTEDDIAGADWCFEVVFDYGEYDAEAPGREPDPAATWPARVDPFSTHRAGFEVRTYRLCRRVLMFHHFESEPGVGNNCLVRSTDLTYRETPVASFVTKVTQNGYRRDGNGYVRRSLPALEFTYSEAVIDETIHDLDPGSLENLPVGVDGGAYRWVDLDGTGLSGVLAEQRGAWLYKPNLGDGRLGPSQAVPRRPSPAALAGGRQQLLDLAGDGSQDLVDLGGPTPGFYERTDDEDWDPFTPFRSLPTVRWGERDVRFVDLNGDGRADVMITEGEALTWHPSLGEDGFGDGVRVASPADEELGPRLVLDDGTQQIYLADMCGDGLSALVRIRNGEVCYWPSLGYGRFGAKVTMDNAPVFDAPDQFHQRRVRLADIDGSGAADLIYLGASGVRLYFNEAGNAWSDARRLGQFPQVDDVASVTVTDLLGNGTACLTWSSPLPGAAGRQMRYVDLMGGQKPHLLVRTVNNLGAETHVHYAPSTKFYLRDRAAGRPWTTRLPFPVHVIERVETYDRISRNRFVTRYAYSGGHFDGVEREFRGFELVEQWDTEEFAALTQDGALPAGDNVDAATHVPPVRTKTWFHLGRRDDTQLPAHLTAEEEREAFRALKGSMLRQEVFADDGTEKAAHPYTVTEQRFGVRCLQRRYGNRHAVFLPHPLESLSYDYERVVDDPRVAHTLTLDVDDFGNVLKQASVAYGRTTPDTSLPADEDRAEQARTRVTYTEAVFTDPVGGEAHLAPVPAESRTYELTGYVPTGPRFRAGDFVKPDSQHPGHLVHDFAHEVEYKAQPTGGRERRLIEHVRTLYRRDDLTGLLDLGKIQPLALPGETYKLAFTPGLLSTVFTRPPGEDLLPDPGSVLGGEGSYVDLDGDGRWWTPNGRVFLSAASSDSAAQERAYAQDRFFLGRRYRDPFGHTSTVEFDDHQLLMRETRDAVGNRISAVNDYRVLQPRRVTDANRNRAEFAFDALGLVVGTALMGKETEALGDTLAGFEADLEETVVLAHVADPLADPHAILGNATTRLVYDVGAYERTGSRPAVACTLTRETHAADPGGAQTKIRHAFSYSDGFGREIQRKIQAEPAAGSAVPRWVGSGWTVFNNKAKPVRRYEPFFTATHRFEFGVAVGVSSILFYDPLARVVATLHPNGTYEKVVFDAWRQATYDVNDTVAPRLPETGDPRTDHDVRGYVARYFATLPAAWQTWWQQRQGTAFGVDEQVAAGKATVHADTPITAHLDALGRPFLMVERNRFERDGAEVEEAHASRVELDIEGNQRAVRDAIEQGGDALGRVVMRYDYDLLGHRIHQSSMDAGRRWMLADVTGKAIRRWDSLGRSARTEYDAARRPLRTFVTGTDEADPTLELLTDRVVYGEQHPDALAGNLRGRAYLHLDQAGAIASAAHDFKGNLLSSSRRIARVYATTIGWDAVDAVLPADPEAALDPVTLEAALAPAVNDGFVTSTTYDALNRVRTLTNPDGTVVRPAYNEAGLLERVDANLRGAVAAGGQPIWTPFVTDVDYDAKGQRTQIVYGSGATNGHAGVATSCEYDPLTYRLTRLTTRRDAAAFPDDCPQPPVTGWPGCGLQDLRYTYDPAGNITRVADAAQQAVFFRNVRVEPSCEYAYDALYRLIEATGREHLGQVGGSPIPHSSSDAARVGIPHPEERDVMGAYAERYVYDAAGNLLEMRHRGTGPQNAGWTQSFTYAEPSLTEAGKTSNRLSTTSLSALAVRRYRHDAHGNMIRMPHLGGADPTQNLHWNDRDQLRQVNLGGGGTVYCVYDAAGQRVRKVWEKAPGLIEERIYLGTFEVFRRTNGSGDVELERETLHITDANKRIALVETRTKDVAGTDAAPAQLVRYQLGNHLDSACLELDGDGQIISYEEFTPYGSTAYQAVRSATDTPKRYRYTGKERDEETGLNYHTARYYAPWLGVWISCDPIGLAGGPNLYRYASANPIRNVDPSGHKPKTVQDDPPQKVQPPPKRSPVPTDLRQAKKEILAAVAKEQKPTREWQRLFPEDPDDPEHNFWVAYAVNYALLHEGFKPGGKYGGTKEDAAKLEKALWFLTKDLRQADSKIGTSESLILRDAQRYLYGLQGDRWLQKYATDHYVKPLVPKELQPELDAVRPYLTGKLIDRVYEQVAKRAVMAGNAVAEEATGHNPGFLRSNPKFPHSRTGGEDWYDLGMATYGKTGKGNPIIITAPDSVGGVEPSPIRLEDFRYLIFPGGRVDTKRGTVDIDPTKLRSLF